MKAVPLGQMSAGITASFSSVDPEAFTVGDAASTGQTLSAFSGKYLVPGSSGTYIDIAFDQQIAAINRQIEVERAKAASPKSSSLNRSTEKFQRLQQEAAFTQSLYQTTLAALEKGRIDAARSVKKISIMQTPTLPEYAEQPRRLYNSLVFALIALLIAGISLLLVSIVRDHFD